MVPGPMSVFQGVAPLPHCMHCYREIDGAAAIGYDGERYHKNCLDYLAAQCSISELEIEVAG